MTNFYRWLAPVSKIPPKIDLKKITFPSDQLSIGTLRRLHPDLFDESADMAGAFFDETKQFEDLMLLVAAERNFADRLFDNAVSGSIRGHPLGGTEFDRLAGDDGHRLTLLWRQFGLTTGPHEAKELLRDLVIAVLGQAAPHVGKGKA